MLTRMSSVHSYEQSREVGTKLPALTYPFCFTITAPEVCLQTCASAYAKPCCFCWTVWCSSVGDIVFSSLAVTLGSVVSQGCGLCCVLVQDHQFAKLVWISAIKELIWAMPSKAGWSSALAEAQPHRLSLLCPYHSLQGLVQLSSLEDLPCVGWCSWPACAGFSAAGGCRASGQLLSSHDLLNGDALGWDWCKEALLPTPHPVCVPFKFMYISLSLQCCLRPFFLTILNSPEGC